MRQPALLRQPKNGRRRNARTASFPAPTGGWNARDNIAMMPVTDAIKLDNFFPGTSDVSLRAGYSQHVTGISSDVESLMPYVKNDGTEVLFGAGGGGDFYNVTSAGAVGAAVVTGLTNDRWHHVNFTNSSGVAYLCCFNGVDAPQYWNNSAWTTITGASTPAITGVTTTSLNKPWIHKRRMWMLEEDSMSAWYLPVDAVGGAATELDMSGLFRKGGKLVAGASWSLDSGAGLDDHWIVITSEGEVLVYRGTDPSSASTWSIVGLWYIGEPVGDRPFQKWGGDLLVITSGGVIPLSKALQSAEINYSLAITDKIQNAASGALTSYASNYGWEVFIYPDANMLLVNVPVSEGASQEQYVMNTITGAWARFTGIESNCWALFNGIPYFGGSTYVGKFWQQYADISSDIEGDLKQAYNYFNDRGSLKQWKMIRPIVTANGIPSVLASINVDYDDSEPFGSLSFSPITTSVWDTATWDSGQWSTDFQLLKAWQTVHGIGNACALRMKMKSQGINAKFQAADYVYEAGEVI